MKTRLIVNVPRGRMREFIPAMKALGLIAIASQPTPTHIRIKLTGCMAPKVKEGEIVHQVNLDQFLESV